LADKTSQEIIHELRVHQIELEIQNEELKKAQREIEVSRDRYVDLYDFAPVGYITLTDAMIINEVNLTGAKMLGVARTLLVQKRFRRFVFSGDQEEWDRFFISVLHQDKQMTCRIRLVGPDGELFFSRIEGIAFLSADQLSYVRLAILDISLQHQAEVKSDISAQRILALLGLYQYSGLQQSEFMEYVLEESLKVVSSSIGFIGLINEDEQVMTAHAWSKEAMASCSVSGAPIHFPLDNAGVWADCVRQKKPVIINDYEALRPKGQHLPTGHVILTRMISVPVIEKDHVVWVIVGANKELPYDDEDEKALTILAHTAWELFSHRLDQHDILINEKRLRKAQYIGEFGNLFYDTGSKKITLSDQVHRICGIDIETWGGEFPDFIAYVYPDDRDLVIESFRLIRENGGKGDIEHRVIRPDGTIRWVHDIIEQSISENGSIVGIEGIIRDITQRKDSERDILNALARITKNLELMAILNDEIRNPLAIITAATDMQGGQYTETILRAVKDIDGIIDRLDRGWLESEKIRSYLKAHYGF
jgi:PAS domain S-box-containing protein